MQNRLCFLFFASFFVCHSGNAQDFPTLLTLLENCEALQKTLPARFVGGKKNPYTPHIAYIRALVRSICDQRTKQTPQGLTLHKQMIDLLGTITNSLKKCFIEESVVNPEQTGKIESNSTAKTGQQDPLRRELSKNPRDISSFFSAVEQAAQQLPAPSLIASSVEEALSKKDLSLILDDSMKLFGVLTALAIIGLTINAIIDRNFNQLSEQARATAHKFVAVQAQIEDARLHLHAVQYGGAGASSPLRTSAVDSFRNKTLCGLASLGILWFLKSHLEATIESRNQAFFVLAHRNYDALQAYTKHLINSPEREDWEVVYDHFLRTIPENNFDRLETAHNLLAEYLVPLIEEAINRPDEGAEVNSFSDKKPPALHLRFKEILILAAQLVPSETILSEQGKKEFPPRLENNPRVVPPASSNYSLYGQLHPELLPDQKATLSPYMENFGKPLFQLTAAIVTLITTWNLLSHIASQEERIKIASYEGKPLKYEALVQTVENALDGIESNKKKLSEAHAALKKARGIV